MNKGSYILLLELEENLNIKLVQKQEEIKKGLYVYIGSAMKNLKQRVDRHISYKDGEYKKHWHIDSLLGKSKILMAFVLPSEEKNEEDISLFFLNHCKPIIGFGATDCKRVQSNLYQIKNLEEFFFLSKRILHYNLEKETFQTSKVS